MSHWFQLVFVFCFCLAQGAFGQDGAPSEVRQPGPYPAGQALENPVEATEQSVAEGKRLYLVNCKLCHGETGAGDPTMKGQLSAEIPDLTDADWTYGSSDGEIFTLIKFGTPNDMQPFEGKLSDRQMWTIVNFLQTLTPVEGAAPEAALTNPVEKNEASLLAGRQNYARFCVECHGMDGRGHTEMNEFLLTKPADLTKDAWRYGTDDGVVFGIIKNGTPNDMPAFAEKFDDEAIWNMVNYLESLRK